MLLLSELSLVRFEGVSEERKAGWRGDWVCMCVFDCVYMCSRGNGERERQRGWASVRRDNGGGVKLLIYRRTCLKSSSNVTSAARICFFSKFFTFLEGRQQMCWGSFNKVSDLISDFVACYQVEQRVNFVLNDTNPPSLLWIEGFDGAQQSCSFPLPALAKAMQ